jgi:peptidoglycan/xylan/chitin deacetylase (PgdA/CDA1 family)
MGHQQETAMARHEGRLHVFRHSLRPAPDILRMLRPLRVLGVGLGAGWLLLCIVGPASLRPPPSQANVVVPLPVGPVQPTDQTPWLTPHIIGYRAHTLQPGEDLASLAQQGGSHTARIESHNHLAGTPAAGRPLLVPHLAGYDNQLPHTSLLVTRGDSRRPWVALTLDAGAGSAPVSAMLDALHERKLRITFFLTGTWIEQNPELVRRMAAEGHEFGNHSLTHADFTTLDDAHLVAELAETERLLQATAGATTRPFFRPPYGAYNERVLLQSIHEGYLPIYWTLDSLDSVGAPKTPEFLLDRITRALTPEELHGAIILAHCGSESTAAALPAVLDKLDTMGLEVRPLSDVLGQ